MDKDKDRRYLLKCKAGSCFFNSFSGLAESTSDEEGEARLR